MCLLHDFVHSDAASPLEQPVNECIKVKFMSMALSNLHANFHATMYATLKPAAI